MAEDHKFNIEYVAKLARLELTTEEKDKFDDQLSKILGYFEKLSDVETEGVEPMAHANPIYDVLREDVTGETLPIEAVETNAPEFHEREIVVPRVIES